MCPWRVFIGVTLGLIWYFWDWGRTVTLYLLGFFFCFTTSVLLGDGWRERSTQTDEETREIVIQESGEQLLCDRTDGHLSGQPEVSEPHYPLVKRSLQQVFDCAYAQLVLPWYNVSEVCEEQPLHRVLCREFDFVIDRIIAHAKEFDVSHAVVGSIRILTQHLHNAKQSNSESMFSCRAEEVALLRELSDAVVRNLFPEHLWGLEVNRCALNEIVALKGLGLLVEWLSDPDNLNQLVVSQLDSDIPKGSVEDLCGSDIEQASLTSQEDEEESSELSLEGAGVSTSRIEGKKKGNKLKQGWSKFLHKMKTKKSRKKKMKMIEQELLMTIMSNHSEASINEEVSSREGSIHSRQDSDMEESDLENYLSSVQEDLMEFKLSYEMWRVGCWAVSIPHADWENEELIFTVHLEEKDSPENLQWDIRKTYTDFIYFRNRWQDSTQLPEILKLEESEPSKELKEEAKVRVEHFLQELISDHVIGHSQPVFQFLCPLDKLLNEEKNDGGVWGILSGLAYFLTPGQEEEEFSSLQTEVPKEAIMPPGHSDFKPQLIVNHDTLTEKDMTAASLTLPTIVISQFESDIELSGAAEAESEEEPQSSVRSDSVTECCPRDKTEDSDYSLTSHFKMIIKGLTLSKSQESLVSRKITDEDQSQSEFCARSNKKEKTTFRLSGGSNKPKGKVPLPREEDSQCERSHVDLEQLEATKVILDLLKEISGNSILMNIFDAILKPVLPILKKKVNSFLNKMNPTEGQVATYIDMMRDKQWPPIPTAPRPARTDEEKNETRERAHILINARYSNFLVLKKTDMESVFNLFQNNVKNKTLVFMLLSFLLREFFPNEHSSSMRAEALQKVINSTT